MAADFDPEAEGLLDDVEGEDRDRLRALLVRLHERGAEADELREALATARTADRITVIAVPTDPEKRVPGFESWWDVPVAAASEQASVRDARSAYDRKRREQRIDIQ